MRHCLRAEGPTGPIPRLSGGMPKPPWTAVLIAPAGVAKRGAVGVPSARRRAIAIAAITVRAEEEHFAAIASSTDHKPEGIQATPCAEHGVWTITEACATRRC